MLRLQEKTSPSAFALFELGFRPFFSAAGLFAVLSMLLWMAMFVFSAHLAPVGMSSTLWHAHEMVFGYAMAVIAGFLLTAVGNWTGIPGMRGIWLAGLLLLWLSARIAFFLPTDAAPMIAAVADLLFVLGLVVAVSRPLIQVRQWKQFGIITKLCLMLLANGAFYAGVLGYLDNGVLWGLYSGLYFVLALVFAMARRVIPFFIERGAGEPFSARNRRWVDIGSMVLFLLWAVLEVFTQEAQVVAWLSLALFVLHVVRMWDWYTLGIWRAPLLWSLYLGYGFLVLGFLLKAMSFWFGISPTLALHAFSAGGIGLITIGMMSRVALGHTGRNVSDPPKALGVAFALLLLGATTRVFAPLLDVAHYGLWIGVSQLLWILAFGLFCVLYLPMLIGPRIDGRPG